MNDSGAREASELASRIRIDSLKMVSRASASHIGTCLSMADILAVLYSGGMTIDPGDPRAITRDRLLISKGHGAAALYATLAARGFFPAEWLETYCRDGSLLGGHITSKGVPGVELSTGSLGHGLGIGCGLAIAAQRKQTTERTFVLLSDGECDEGSIWEAALFAAHHRLDNLVAIVDYNKIQSFGRVSDVLALEPFADKWAAFGWEVREVDGHSIETLIDVFASLPFTGGRPSCILAHTVKGKGVSFMEDRLAWHYKSPSSNQLQQAIREVEGTA